eukprot:gene9291-6531_t
MNHAIDGVSSLRNVYRYSSKLLRLIRGDHRYLMYVCLYLLASGTKSSTELFDVPSTRAFSLPVRSSFLKLRLLFFYYYYDYFFFLFLFSFFVPFFLLVFSPGSSEGAFLVFPSLLFVSNSLSLSSRGVQSECLSHKKQAKIIIKDGKKRKEKGIMRNCPYTPEVQML